MIIAIDGPSGTGKSTVAQRVARELGFIYFNTGAMYRSFAVYVSRKNIPTTDLHTLVDALSMFQFDIKHTDGENRYSVNGEDVTRELHLESVSKIASELSAYEPVRSDLLPIQRQFGGSHDVVFEGRDIGTVVFPEAEVKVFLTAEADVRAARRKQQLDEKYPGQEHDVAQILQEIQARDTRDTTRAVAPLKKAEDAVEIDSSDMSIDEVVATIVGMCRDR